MARPKKDNPADVAGDTLTIRITGAETEALERLADRRSAQLAAYGVQQVTKASLVRSLLQQALRAEGLLSAPAQVALPLPLLAPSPVPMGGAASSLAGGLTSAVSSLAPLATPAPSPAPVAAPAPAVVAAPEPKPKASPSKANGKAPAPKAAPAEQGDADPLRDRYVAAKEAGKITNKEVADALGLADGSSVSRWAGGKGTLAALHRPTVEKLLKTRGC